MDARSRLAPVATYVPHPASPRDIPASRRINAESAAHQMQVKRVFCESSGALVPKDKAVKRFIVRNIVESAAIRDLQESCVFDGAERAATGCSTHALL